MPTEDTFRALIRKVRAGDADAAAELVRQYEPEIRRAVRVRLSDPRLGRVLDSMDISQSVLANFFVRAAAGQFELGQPEQLLRLLIKMARNKLLDQVRRQQAERRDQRRLQSGELSDLANIPDPGQTPSQIVAGRELLEALRRRLSREEQYLADQRARGLEWSQIAADLGGTAEALRKQLGRALDRAARDMGLE
jgi:RNA polymerase sigma-70 factor (ECF subfamily)